MTLDPEILDRPAEEGARILCLALCADAEAAARRVGSPDDPEALHDFRVALRRMRSAMRACRALLGEVVADRDRKALRRLARRTGPARDAEVLLGWLGSQEEKLPEAYRGALQWLAERIEQARRSGYTAVEGEVAPAFASLAPALARRLAAGGAAVAAEETFGAALAALLREQAIALRDALGNVAGPADASGTHRARIEAKRLRYLLEPLRGNARADAAEAVKGLRKLQEVLGELNDAHRAAAETASALVVAAAERARRRPGESDGGPDLRPGLLAIERLCGERATDLHRRLAEGWLDGRATALLDAAYAVVAALERRDVGTPAAERRLLLSALPETALGDAEEVERGWLPGDRRESVARVRSGEVERFYRATVQGKGAQRVEAVDEIPRGDFEAYWPLTEGRRIRKRCHRPPGLGWHFEEYLDRRLAMAVAAASDGVPPPEWLEPLVVRDVTGERGYQDEVLARRGRPANAGR